jgi:hypothetical protein
MRGRMCFAQCKWLRVPTAQPGGDFDKGQTADHPSSDCAEDHSSFRTRLKIFTALMEQKFKFKVVPTPPPPEAHYPWVIVEIDVCDAVNEVAKSQKLTREEVVDHLMRKALRMKTMSSKETGRKIEQHVHITNNVRNGDLNILSKWKFSVFINGQLSEGMTPLGWFCFSLIALVGLVFFFASAF